MLPTELRSPIRPRHDLQGQTIRILAPSLERDSPTVAADWI